MYALCGDNVYFFGNFLRKLFQEQVIEEGAYVMLNLLLFLPSNRSELFNVVLQLFFLLESVCVQNLVYVCRKMCFQALNLSNHIFLVS